MNIKIIEEKEVGGNIYFNDNGDVGGSTSPSKQFIFNIPEYKLKDCVITNKKLVVTNSLLAELIANKWGVRELIEQIDSPKLIPYVKEYKENVISDFYLEDREAYDSQESYEKGVWNQTFYEGGVAYSELIAFIKSNLCKFKKEMK